MDDGNSNGSLPTGFTRPVRASKSAPSLMPKSGLLLERHARHEVGDARLGGKAPVFVPVQNAVAIQIPESLSANGENRGRAHAQRWLLR